MSIPRSGDQAPPGAPPPGAPQPGFALLLTLSMAQFMVVLDLTVMNIALPSAQRALGFTTVDRVQGQRWRTRNVTTWSATRRRILSGGMPRR
jgi:hypothetical protein